MTIELKKKSYEDFSVVDLFCGIGGLTHGFVQQNFVVDAGVDFEAVGTIYSPGLYGIGVPPDESKWRDKISFALQDMLNDGTYEKIYDKWFGPKGRFPLPINARPRLPKDTYGDMLYIWPD